MTGDVFTAYVVNEGFFRQDPQIECAEVKEQPTRYSLSRYCSGFGYRKCLSLSTELARTPEEAVAQYLKKKAEAVEHCKQDLDKATREAEIANRWATSLHDG